MHDKAFKIAILFKVWKEFTRIYTLQLVLSLKFSLCNAGKKHQVFPIKNFCEQGQLRCELWFLAATFVCWLAPLQWAPLMAQIWQSPIKWKVCSQSWGVWLDEIPCATAPYTSYKTNERLKQGWIPNPLWRAPLCIWNKDSYTLHTVCSTLIFH